MLIQVSELNTCRVYLLVSISSKAGSAFMLWCSCCWSCSIKLLAHYSQSDGVDICQVRQVAVSKGRPSESNAVT